MRVSYDAMYSAVKERLKKYGVGEEIASGCARNLVENTQYGVASHGINRFPRLVEMLKNGAIRPDGKPVRISGMGALEQWDGNLGMGNTNAELCMARAIELAKQYGIGCVALRHTNHWLRAGAYGAQAAKAGCVGICWTNTMPNMPAWGAKDRHIGNNPLVFCIPYESDYVMIDCAMAQFSYGAIEAARIAGRDLPVVGGYDKDGNITKSPASIEETWRVLPIGFWKGSGFSVLLDMLAASLSGGMSVSDIGKQGAKPTDEYNLSQVFIAIYVSDKAANNDVVRRIIADVKSSEPADAGAEILYPYEKELSLYKESLELGVPVDEGIWQSVQAL